MRRARAPDRPRASSRETLAEAACELFLEQGFEATSIADITTRAGVSRSSFFNYFASKSDILWSGLDERIADVRGAPRRRARRRMRPPTSAPRRRRSPTDFAPGQPRARPRQRRRRWGSTTSSSARRRSGGLASRARSPDRLPTRRRRSPARRCRRRGVGRRGARGRWTRGRTTARGARPRRDSSRAPIAAAAASLSPAAGAVRQLRVVVQAPDFDAALAFYRDVARDAAGRGVRGRGRRARGDPRCRTGDARARQPRAGRLHRRRRDGRRHERPRSGSRSRSTTPRRSPIASPLRVPRWRHPLARRRGGRSTPACGRRPACSSRCSRSSDRAPDETPDPLA